MSLRIFSLLLLFSLPLVAFGAQDQIVITADLRPTTTPTTTPPVTEPTTTPPVQIPAVNTNANGPVEPLIFPYVNPPETISGGAKYSFDANVYDLQVHTYGTSVSISWKNPQVPEFDSVRVVRSEQFFPSAIVEGKVIYEGAGTSIFDTDVEIGKTYFYTIFAKDKYNNFSSGVVVKVIVPPANLPPKDPTLPLSISLDDFLFIQSDHRSVPQDSSVGVWADKKILVLLPYERIPEETKNIVLEVAREDGTVFSATLFASDELQKLFEASIPPMQNSSRGNIIFYDAQDQEIGRLKANFIVHLMPKKFDMWPILIILAIILVLFKGYEKRKELRGVAPKEK
jgi:hypothetical protein